MQKYDFYDDGVLRSCVFVAFLFCLFHIIPFWVLLQLCFFLFLDNHVRRTMEQPFFLACNIISSCNVTTFVIINETRDSTRDSQQRLEKTPPHSPTSTPTDNFTSEMQYYAISQASPFESSYEERKTARERCNKWWKKMQKVVYHMNTTCTTTHAVLSEGFHVAIHKYYILWVLLLLDEMHACTHNVCQCEPVQKTYQTHRRGYYDYELIKCERKGCTQLIKCTNFSFCLYTRLRFFHKSRPLWSAIIND